MLLKMIEPPLASYMTVMWIGCMHICARTTTEEDAADLTQHVFVQALHALPQYRVRAAPFAAWLFRIARNVAIDAHRRRRITVAWDFIPEALQPMGERDPEDGA